jgi:hypothetical protein
MLRLAGQVPVCDGDELTDAWRRAVADSSLIRLCDDPDRVYSVVAECAGRCRSAAKYLADRTGLTDPWTDPGYPARVLNKTELLLRNARLLGGPAAVPGNAAVGTTTVDNAMAHNAAVGNAVAAILRPGPIPRSPRSRRRVVCARGKPRCCSPRRSSGRQSSRSALGRRQASIRPR